MPGEAEPDVTGQNSTNPDRLALAGLRVLEVGSGSALAYTGKLFADFGAEVIKAEAPGGDAWRQMPPRVRVPGRAEPESALFAWLNTNKHSVTADPQRPDEAAWLARLARGCDVVLDARALDQGLAVLTAPVWSGSEESAAALPSQIVFTWFGESGPYSGFSGSESVCRALSGAVHNSGPKNGPPHLPHDVQTGILAGLQAFSAAMAALIGRQHGPRRYAISLHEAAFGAVELEAGMVQDKRHPGRLGVNRFCGTHPAGIFETADGWLGLFTHTLPQWAALCEALGRPAWARDPAFANGALRMARADEIDAWLGEALRSRPAAAWFDLLGAKKHPAVLVPTMAELLQQAVHRERGAFVPVRLGAGDATVSVEGPVVPLRLDTAGPLPGGPAPALGEHDAHYRGAGLARSAATAAVPPGQPVLAEQPVQPVQPRPPAAARERLPLEGLRIIDLSMGWAGPLASRSAADFGAEVIKVESIGYPDWWRGANFTDEFYRERLYEKNANFNLMNRHKQGITLDLTRPEGKALLLRLVAHADAVIENYSAEVLPKLGLDYPALRAVNPRLVMVSMPAFGLDNAWSNTRAYGGTLEQASGLPLYTGHPDGPPAMTSYAYGDPVGGFNAGAALLLALWDQRRSGRGRHLNLSQVEAMLVMTAPFLLAQSATGSVPPRAGNRHPLHAPFGCYAGSGQDDWLLLDVAGQAQWLALCRVLDRPDWATDAALAHAAGRRMQHDRLDAGISAWAARHSADAAMAALQAVGIAAGVVRSMPALLDDPHLHASGFWQVVERPYAGRYLSSTPVARAGAGPAPLRQVAPTLGQHGHTVLGGLLGLGEAQLSALDRQGITGTAAVPK